ncbi:transposable element Tcb2 transposase [Trichonephila clavipes]|nr:transposable element Tcb2 transposase [Trichonephila clavipes]
MSLRSYRKQYEQLSEIERERITGMMEAVLSAWKVARQISLREYRHFIRDARVEPTASFAVVQTHAAPSLRAPLSSRTTSRCLAEGYLVSRHPLRVLPMAPSHQNLLLEWCRTRRDWSATEWNQVVFSDESRFKLHSNDNRVRLRRPRDERLNPAFALQRHTTHSRCDGMGYHCLRYMVAANIDPGHNDSPSVSP